MLVIGYGIAAVIVIVLLILFNVRATSSRSSAGKGVKGKEQEPLETEVLIPEAASSADVVEPEGSADYGRDRVAPERSRKNDLSYRNALRDMRMGTGTGTGDGTEVPERKIDSERMPDSDYRNAMRNHLYKSSNDEKDKG